MKDLLIITSTITPQITAHLKVTSGEERKRQLLHALEINPVPDSMKIVLLENSGHDLSFLPQGVRGVSVPRPALDPLQSKGLGEWRMLRHYFDSVLDPLFFPPERMIYKLTGRHVLNRLPLFIQEVRSQKNRSSMLAPMLVGDFRFALSFMDSRFFGASMDFWKKYFLKEEPVLDESKGFYLEHFLAQKAHLFLQDGGRFLPFPMDPEICGISGTSGQEYGTANPVRRWARRIRARLKYKLFQY